MPLLKGCKKILCENLVTKFQTVVEKMKVIYFDTGHILYSERTTPGCCARQELSVDVSHQRKQRIVPLISAENSVCFGIRSQPYIRCPLPSSILVVLIVVFIPTKMSIKIVNYTSTVAVICNDNFGGLAAFRAILAIFSQCMH